MNDNKIDANKPVLDTQETAALLGVTTSAIKDWSTTGVIPSHKIGGVRRYNRREIMALVGGDNPVNDSTDPITAWLIDQLNKRRQELAEI